jgi:hypothetical protein
VVRDIAKCGGVERLETRAAIAGASRFGSKNSVDALTCGRLGGSGCLAQHGGQQSMLSTGPSFRVMCRLIVDCESMIPGGEVANMPRGPETDIRKPFPATVAVRFRPASPERSGPGGNRGLLVHLRLAARGPRNTTWDAPPAPVAVSQSRLHRGVVALPARSVQIPSRTALTEDDPRVGSRSAQIRRPRWRGARALPRGHRWWRNLWRASGACGRGAA